MNHCATPSPLGASLCPQSFARVYCATWRDIPVAVKLLLGADAASKTSANALAEGLLAPGNPVVFNLEQEANLLAALRHPNVVGVSHPPPLPCLQHFLSSECAWRCARWWLQCVDWAQLGRWCCCGPMQQGSAWCPADPPARWPAGFIGICLSPPALLTVFWWVAPDTQRGPRLCSALPTSMTASAHSMCPALRISCLHAENGMGPCTGFSSPMSTQFCDMPPAPCLISLQ